MQKLERDQLAGASIAGGCKTGCAKQTTQAPPPVPR